MIYPLAAYTGVSHDTLLKSIPTCNLASNMSAHHSVYYYFVVLFGKEGFLTVELSQLAEGDWIPLSFCSFISIIR